MSKSEVVRKASRSLEEVRLRKALQAGIDSPDVDVFGIKRVIAKLLRERERSGLAVPWQPEKIKELARQRVRRQTRRQ